MKFIRLKSVVFHENLRTSCERLGISEPYQKFTHWDKIPVGNYFLLNAVVFVCSMVRMYKLGVCYGLGHK